jgi:hypothetical protein
LLWKTSSTYKKTDTCFSETPLCVPTEMYVGRIPDDCDLKTCEIWHKDTRVWQSFL